MTSNIGSRYLLDGVQGEEISDRETTLLTA